MVRKNISGRRPYKELTFTDDYIFCKVLENDLELARQLLEVILEKKIQRVELSDPQHTISVDPDIRSVRLDVYLEDDAGTVFDLEMQTAHKELLPRRSRYYQSIMDIDHLASGMNYNALPETYVIFICMFDPCNMGLARYEFRSLCAENPEIELADGTRKVFLNAACMHEDISPELRALFDYLMGNKPASNLTKYISDSVSKAKTNRRWEREYVTVGEKIREECELARAEERSAAMTQAVDAMINKLGMTAESACDVLGYSFDSYIESKETNNHISDVIR